MWLRSRFKANEDDYRPVIVPPPGPWWCSGYGDGYSIVIAYHRPDQDIKLWWPEATDIDSTEEETVAPFTDRFPKPDEWDETTEKWIDQ